MLLVGDYLVLYVFVEVIGCLWIDVWVVFWFDLGMLYVDE